MPSSTLILTVIVSMAVASALAWLAIWRDKRRSERGQPRIPERTLHILELLGGWPGAMLARRRFRHKTRKTGYRVIAALCAVTHVAAAVAAWRLLS